MGLRDHQGLQMELVKTLHGIPKHPFQIDFECGSVISVKWA